MGYYIDVIIGIRTGGVFSGPVDLDDLKQRIAKILEEKEIYYFDLDHCLSRELRMYKGSYVVLAGVSNGWLWESSAYATGVSDFAKILSKEFGTEVMAMSWDEQTDRVWYGVFLDGKPLSEVYENPIGRIIRRVT